MAPDDGPSSNLQSKKIYYEFEKGKECSAEAEGTGKFSQVKTGVERLLEGRTHIPKADANKIVKNYCDACGGINRTERGHYYEPCYSFYYWLGTKIKGKEKTANELHDTMQKIYTELSPFKCNNKCSEIYLATSDILLDESKKMFEFGYNYESLKGWSEGKEKPCWPEYNEHWDAAKKAYEKKDVLCGTDQKCKTFMSNYDQYFKDRQQAKELPCNSISKVQEQPDSKDAAAILSGGEEDDEEDDLDYLEDDLLEEGDEEEDPSLDDLPSRKKYKVLNEKADSDNKDDCNSAGWQKIKSYVQDESVEYKIKGAMCYVYDMDDSERKKEGWCDYSYYWVGKILRKEFKDGPSFRQAMKKVKKAMQRSRSDHGCSFKFPTKGRTYFKQSKFLFDYYKDKDVVVAKVKSDQEEDCSNPYYKYLLKAQSAYEYMQPKCEKDNKSEWCKAFKTMYGQCKDPGKTVPECVVANKPEEPCNSGPKPGAEASTLLTTSGTSPGSNSTITAVASSALAVMGTAFITLFLYRVNTVTVEI
ncbi:KIR protein [Plasmodium coatneyi]|uniref:KIR protein n=1 Tax=Plasmodium coatneyi TaxID=208452 RepID=A0A1B1E523_9APIC|nr:KIR protein [Plasmodium coatneyi]ANQ10077.1 KIR protein [Plasmodium coatneyi]